jgi:uncharacterized protein (DUF433 family)
MMPDRIVIDPAIQHGKPVLRGTRVPMVRILGGLAGSMTPTEVCQEYDISEDDLRAVLAYAVTLIEADQFQPLPHRPVSA